MGDEEGVNKPYEDFLKIFTKDMKALEKNYKTYQKESSDTTPIPSDPFDLFIEWALHYQELCDEDLHTGNCTTRLLSIKNIHKAGSKDQFLKSYIPDFAQRRWPIRFSRRFIKKLGDIRTPQLRMEILRMVKANADGAFGSKIPVAGLSYMLFFKSSQKPTIVSSIHLERYPEFDKSDSKIKAFHYAYVIRFLDLLYENDKVKAADSCLSFIEDCKKDPARQECRPTLEKKIKSKTLTIDDTYSRLIYGNAPSGSYNSSEYAFEEWEGFGGKIMVPNPLFENKDPLKSIWFAPNRFEINYLTPEEMEDLVYNKESKRWVSKKAYELFLRRQENALVSKMNAEILEKFADFESSSRLVELLEKVKNLKIKLTQEEKRLIGQSGNVLAIGRSGTGKTTCCVLRLFSQDMLYKLRLAQAQVKNGGVLRDARNVSDKLEDLIGIHSIFVTASPVLCNEVSRYYTNLSKRIQDEMKRKEQAKKASKEEEKVEKSNKKENSDIVEDIVIDKPVEENVQEEGEDLDAFNEEDYLIDDEEAEIKAKLNKNYSLENIEEKEFPLFLTIKRIVLMIDGTLQQPFFERKSDNSIIGSNTQAQWHNEMKGLMVISDKYRQNAGAEGDNLDNVEVSDIKDLSKDKEGVIEEENEEEEEADDEKDLLKIDDSDIEAEYVRYQAILKKKRAQAELEEEMRKKNKLSFEVDYDYFLNHFWRGYLYRNNLRENTFSPILVWSEIMSSIKGSAESHLFPGFYLPKDLYCSQEKDGTTLLDIDKRTKVYELFASYEEWKKKEGGYDFMDIVNHALNEIRTRGYYGVPIHFIMIDEVQDLSHATILLLMRITEQNVFFAGDTAQTIAKGVGVRFSDLSTLFKHSSERELVWKKPTVHQLTINFRSHGRILDLANSIVSLMETFFPKTIDKLKKEKSEVDGPKPILLEDDNLEILFGVLFGAENFKSHRHSQNQGGALEKPPIEFGCNQAIIVRDQESKKKLPPLLKHALCLTVYEAKGLEFDDVILYNFFSESPLSAKEWELLKYLDIEHREVDKEVFERHYFTYKEEELSDLNNEENFGRKAAEENQKDDLDLQAPNIFNLELDEKQNKYTLNKVSLPKKAYESLDFTSYSMLCNEFKQLYVALTRPRNRIVIYDDNIFKRQHMERYWRDLSLVQIINKNILEKQSTEGSSDKDLESFKSLIASTSQSEWKKQGLRMFKNKYYEQAVKCFEKAEDEQLRLRSEAYMIAERASERLTQVKNEQALLTKDDKNKDKQAKEKKEEARNLKNKEKTCYEEYEKAAEIFFSLDLLKQAAKCFFSAGVYQKALEIYEKLDLFREAGEACFMLQEYERTAELFMKGGDFIRAIESYELIKDYNKILEIVENLKDLPAKQRKYYAQRYVPLALQGLIQELEPKSPVKVVESQKEETSNNFSLVSEKNKPEIKEIEEVKNSDYSLKKGEKKEISDMSFNVSGQDKKKDISDLSFVEVTSQTGKNASDISFEDVDKLDDYEHLSYYDANDEFLKNESESIIDSIASHRKNQSVISSDYSAVEYNYLMNNHYHLVETKADIFVQDVVMEKIIKYITMFSEDFKENLQNLPSKDVLLTKATSTKQLIQETETHDLIDLDNISLDFVYFILDFLEQSKLNKLCIFVCNRYRLADKLGRYLVNMAFKYSNFPHEDIRATFAKLSTPRTRQIQQEKAFLANTVLHKVLEIINPNYLKLKKKGEPIDDTNSLGTNCFSSLISLGFWKKCLFMMDYKNSMGVASTFASFPNYKLIFLTGSNEYNVAQEKVKSLVEGEGFEFLLFDTPKTDEETKAAIIGLEGVIWSLMEKFPLDLYKHYRPGVKAFSQVKVPTFPSYFTYNKALWNYIINKNKEEFEAHLLSAPNRLEKLLKNKDSSNKIAELEVFDVASFLVQTLIFYSTNPSIADIINKVDIKSGMKLMTAFRNVMEYTSLISYAHRYDETVLRAILCPLRVRLIERTTVLKGLGLNNYTVHISSPIMADMLAAENTNTPAIMCDIEGDFRLASKDLCLKGIRKRLTAGLKVVLDSQTRAHLSRCPLEVYVAPQDLKSYLEDRAQVLGMISCYEYCQDLVEGIIRRKPEVKKTKTPKKKVEQEYVADEEVDDYEDMVASYKENGVKVHYKSTWKAPQQKKKSPTKGGNGESESSVQSLRGKILKDLKEALRTYVDIKLDLDYYSRTELLSFGLRKLGRYLQQKEARIWVAHLFYYLDSHVTLNEYLRKNKKSTVAEQLHGYSDALYFRKFLCSQDYVHGVLEFLSSSFKNPTNKQIMDLASILENLIPYTLIADSLGQKAKQVSLSASLLPYINTRLTKESKQVLEANILPLADGEIFEVFSWVATLCEGGVDCERVLRLLVNLFANIPGLDEDALNTLTDAVAGLLDADPFAPYTKDAKDKTKNSKTKTDPKETKDPILQNIIDNFSELNVLNQDDFLGLPEFYKVEEFVSLTIKSNEKEAQKNFTKSEKAWVHDMAMIAKRITLQKRLARLFKRRKGLKLRERATFNHFKTDFASELVETALSLNDTNLYKLQGYIGAIDLKTEIFEVIDKGIRQVMTYYAKSTFASPLDFHYISNIMQKLIVCGEDYTEALKEGLKSPENRKKIDVSSLYKEKSQEVEGIVKDFEKWCDDKALQDNTGEKEVKTKKLVRAKWEEEAIMAKMQQIAKKRKGLKRQELQQRKNMLLGLFKKS